MVIFLITESESEYENLEPWIQWPSVHTGLPFKDHKILRLKILLIVKRIKFLKK